MTDDAHFRSLLISGSAAYGLTLEPASLLLFSSYADLVRVWNTRMNLVSSLDLARFAEYHLLDSLKIACCFDLSACGRLMDFGSGAGLPGIPLAIAFPGIDVCLVESIGKKCAFLCEVVSSLNLPNVTVLRSRIEEIPSSLDYSFGCVVTRATVSLERFYRNAARFVRRSGSLVSIKGDPIDTELRRLEKRVDARVFHILTAHPVPVSGVRTGTVVIITRK